MSYNVAQSASGSGTTAALGGTTSVGNALVLFIAAIQTAADNLGLPGSITDSQGNTYSLLHGAGSSAINQACASGNFVSYAIYVCARNGVSSFTLSCPIPPSFSTASTTGIRWFFGEFTTGGVASFQNNGSQALLSETAPFSLSAGSVPAGTDELALGFTFETGLTVGGSPRFTSYLNELNNPSTQTDWGFQDANVAGGTGVVAANVNPGAPAPPFFVPTNAAGNTFASGTGPFTVTLPVNVTAGHAIVVSVSVLDFSPDLPVVTDSQGNTYNLVVSNTSFEATYAFVALNCNAGATTVSVSLPSAAACGIGVAEFGNVATASAVDGTASAHGSGAISSLSIGPMTTAFASDLLVSLLFTNTTGGAFTAPSFFNSATNNESGNGQTFNLAYRPGGVPAGAQTVTWPLLSGQTGSSTTGLLFALKPPVTTSPETMGFLVRLAPLNATGGSASSSLAFRILKAPAPVVPHEGRAIATVQVDCTQITFAPIQTQGGAFPQAQGLQYPEYTFDPSTGSKNSGFEAFAVTEFDLEHITNRGQGLTEVRGIMAVSRPMFQFNINDNQTDSPFTGGFVLGKGIAILTNVATLQSAILGEKAMAWHQGLDTQGAPVETMHMPFYAVKGGMKFRLLLLSSLWPLTNGQQTGVGKYTINFTNFELPSSFVHVGGWYGDL